MSDSNLLAPAGNISKEIAVGSRNSELALKQTHSVISLIKKHHPDKKLRLVSMSTTGDKIIHIALPKIGEKSLFTKELEVALLAKEVQFVVHSLKDLPTTLPEGLVLGAILKREDPRDAVIMQKKFQGEDLSSLPRMSTIGTSSLRRKSQLLSRFPHLKVESIRGNLNTRLRKLEEGNQFSAIVLAMAGLSRMGWESKVSKVLLESEMMYAVGQGALAVECVEEDTETLNVLSVLHHRDTALQVVAERSFLSALGGGCSAPVGVVSRFRDDGVILELEGGVWSLDGVKMLRKKLCCSVKERVIETMPRKKLAHSQPIVFCGIVSPVPDVDLYKTAYKLGQDLAAALLSEGASAIMEEARKANESS